MRVFAVSGYSGTGKTALVEALVSSLVERGFSVATIKSSKHEAGPEQGSDTWRHSQAGASMTIFLRVGTGDLKLRDSIGADDFSKLSKHDFLIIEGMKSANIPKFWCVGDTEIDLKKIPPSTQAIVSWSESQSSVQDIPVISAHQIGQLVEIVKGKALDFVEIE